MIAMIAISGMTQPPRSSLPSSTVSLAGATSGAVCADAIVDAVINATDAVAAKSPLKPTSASPFVLESDLSISRPTYRRHSRVSTPKWPERRDLQPSRKRLIVYED